MIGLSPRLIIATFTLWLAGCAIGAPEPQPPYMSPYPAGQQGYGYSEERIAADIWRVTYRWPWQDFAQYPAARKAELDRAAAAAGDLALWRAAQLALAEAKPAFAITDRRTDTETKRQAAGYVYDPFWPYDRPSASFGRYPYWHRPLWSTPEYIPGYAAGRATATLTIRLEKRAGAGSLDAAATAERLRSLWDGRAPPR